MSEIVDQQLVQVPVTSSHIQQKDTTYTKIFVGGLPYHTTDKSLKQFFESFGEIEEAVVITDRQTGKSRGYGFVTMADREAADRAVKDANPIIDGRKANVNLAYLGAKPRINAQNGFQSHLRSTYPYVIPNQYGSVNNSGLLKSFDSHEKWPTLLDYPSLSPHYVYHTPSAYVPTSGLILSGPPSAHAPLSPAAAATAAAASFYTEYAPSYPPQYGGAGLEYAPYAGALAPLPHSNGAAPLPPYLGGHPTYAAYALPPPPPSAHQGAAHFPVPPYSAAQAPPQDSRMQ